MRYVVGKMSTPTYEKVPLPPPLPLFGNPQPPPLLTPCKRNQPALCQKCAKYGNYAKNVQNYDFQMQISQNENKILQYLFKTSICF